MPQSDAEVITERKVEARGAEAQAGDVQPRWSIRSRVAKENALLPAVRDDNKNPSRSRRPGGQDRGSSIVLKTIPIPLGEGIEKKKRFAAEWQRPSLGGFSRDFGRAKAAGSAGGLFRVGLTHAGWEDIKGISQSAPWVIVSFSQRSWIASSVPRLRRAQRWAGFVRTIDTSHRSLI